MIAPASWRCTYLSSPAAAHLRAYLDGVLLSLEGARIERALDLLERWVWPDTLDRAVLPVKVLDVTEQRIAEAHRYLMEADPDVTSAKDALRDALALYETE